MKLGMKVAMMSILQCKDKGGEERCVCVRCVTMEAVLPSVSGSKRREECAFVCVRGKRQKRVGARAHTHRER